MQIQDWLMIIAVLAGPIIAVQLTRYIDNRKEKRQRKLNVFRTLMSTRATRLSSYHVEALNMIDLEFSKNNERELNVIEAWKEYLDALSDQNLNNQHGMEKRSDLFIDLLHRMAVVVDYKFDKVHIKNGAYSPVAHGQYELDHQIIRGGLIELLEGKRNLNMHVTNLSSEVQAPAEEKSPVNI